MQPLPDHDMTVAVLSYTAGSKQVIMNIVCYLAHCEYTYTYTNTTRTHRRASIIANYCSSIYPRTEEPRLTDTSQQRTPMIFIPLHCNSLVLLSEGERTAK